MILQEVFAPVDEIKPLSKEQMDEMDKARESDDYVTPELQKPAPGFFDGMGEGAWKGIASSALKSASALDTVMSSTGMVRAALNNAQVETGYTFDDLDLRQSEIENRLDQDSKELRRRAREDYGPDPTTMGTAAQIIYGVAETIPKAIGYSVLAGPAGGSVLFGADLGISRAQELMDEGVDKNTAINAGLVTFAAGSLGMRLPATFGRSRIASATIGAVANMGLTAAELQGVNWVLQNQNYNELAEKYQLNVIDMATSGIFGGVLGGVMWRPSATASVAQNAAARRAPLRDRIYNSLRRASPENISDDAIRVQADLHAAGIQVMADRAQIDADSIAPEIVRSESPDGFNQPVTQDSPWHMGSQVIGRELEPIKVVHAKPVEQLSRRELVDKLTTTLRNGLNNSDTGWILTGSRSDAKKSLSIFKFDTEVPGLYDALVNQFDEIVDNAKLIESHRDLQHNNKDVKGIHKFSVPFEHEGRDYRVQLLVRDYGDAVGSRLATHSIDAVEVFSIGKGDGEGVMAPLASVSSTSVLPGATHSPDAGLSSTWSSSDEISLSELLNGFKREDGKTAFDAEDESSYLEGGVYYDSLSSVNNPLLTVHNISQDNLLKANQLGGLAVPSLGIARGSFDPARNRITLTPNANISTYSHEMGHWYLENLFQLSRRAVSESTLKEDADILLKEFGVKSLDDWDALGIEGQRKYQEQFASWVEIYLSEGRAPKPALQRLFERLGQWLVDLYRELGGVKKAVGDTYKAETGSELPPVSEEVGKVLDRLFDQDRKVRKASQVSKAQVAAARMVQANRTNNNKLEEILAMPTGKNKTRALRDLEKSTQAQLKAIQAAKRGLPVDVSQEVEQMNVDVDRLVEMKGNFGRAYVMGNTDSAVVLQNRDRSDVGSIGQMNAIAANPQYGLVSVSRSYSGAPVVSYGSVPDSAHLGNNDFIVETNGNRVPFMYAVVEAGDVETSNFIDGSTNAGYGNPQRMNAVVGNGRMTALKEAYQRGTANQYRTDLESDTAHGIKPEVIREMKNPVLVRVINPEDVNTGFISRSNGQQVLALDDVEVAREDAPKIRARAGQYEFDEAGNPTNDTLALFIQDLHDPNALGRLITSDGRPTPEAVRRIRNAVFFEAYQSPELSALFSQEVDSGIRRILNGLANVAPRIIELREQAQELDFSNLLVEAANRIRQARLNPDEGVDFASQMSFLDNPATSAFVEFLDDNANSAAAIARTLNPLIDWAENAARAADGGLFGGDAEVHVDLADVVGQLRNIINEQRAGAGLELLPEIDVASIRDQIQAAVNTATDAVDEVGARLEAETQQAEVEMANEAQALDVQRQQSLAVLDEKTSVDARAQFLMDQNPDQVYRVLDENGMEVEGTLSDLLAQADEAIRQAEVEASGIGRAVECVLRNGGIQ